MEHKQGITRLCENLASIIDRFDGLGEASRNNSYEMFHMFMETAETAPRNYLGFSGQDASTCYRYQTLPTMLTDAGFYILGRGHFSLVLGHDDQPGTAFKLSLKPEDSYVAYAMYCRQNPGLHLPEIRCMIRAQEGQVIALKRYITFHEGLAALPPGVEFPHASYHFMQYWREADTTRRDHQSAIAKNPIYTESYIKALIGIGEHFDGAATFDLHDENLMFDLDTCTFIITDPVSFKKENRNAFRQPRKARDRTNHFAPAQAGAVADAAARSLGAAVKQVRQDVHNRGTCPKLSVPKFVMNMDFSKLGERVVYKDFAQFVRAA